MKTLKSKAMIAAMSIIFFSCQKSEVAQEKENIETERIVTELAGKSSNANQASSNAKLARPQSWADCLMFDGVVTPAKFNPESDPFDELYVNNLGIGFKDGKALISESKPGDQDYNGGRWHMNVIKPDVDPMKYMNACSDADIDLNDFMSTDVYFECPLLPRK